MLTLIAGTFMLWMLISLLFLWLIYRELKNAHSKPIYKPYLAILVILALSFAWPPYHQWRLERFFTAVALQLAENHPAKVHCNTLFDTIFDEEVRVAGHADIATGYIVIQYPYCSKFIDYLNHPEHATQDEIFVIAILAHESMHARGERNEAKTECQAVQRYYRTAKLLGIPDSIAKKNALDYYNNYYMKRVGSYFSKECAPGKALDEHLSDSTWSE